MTALALVTAALAAATAALAVVLARTRAELTDARLHELAARRDVDRLETAIFTLTERERP